MTAITTTARSGWHNAKEWATRPIPYGRVAAFRSVVYLFLPIDLLVITPWAVSKGTAGELYNPLRIAEILLLPAPNPLLVNCLHWGLIIAGPIAATGLFPRLLGFPIFLAYTQLMIIAMSFGKVDHDRVAFMVALAVLPFLGRAKQGDSRLSENAGYGFRLVQLMAIATYFLAFWSKVFRSGFIAWGNSAVYTKAVMRAGTFASFWTLKIPGLLVFAQWGTMLFELLSPAYFFVTQRLRYGIIAFFYLFHMVGFIGISIGFWPHMIAMLCFLPLEKPVQALQRRYRRRPDNEDVPSQNTPGSDVTEDDNQRPAAT